MQSTSVASRVALLAIALITGGCGVDAPANDEPLALEGIAPGTPLAEIPRERLYGASSAENLWSPKYELEVPGLPDGWNGVRIAMLSDFHLGLWDENQAVVGEAVYRAVESGADIIALLGDYVNTAEDLPALREVLAPLRGKRVLAVLGDRDVRSDSLAARITAVLQESGVLVLRNTSARIAVREDTAWIAGLDAEVLNNDFGDQRYIMTTLGPAGRTAVLLSHVPALATRSPIGRFPVVLSGNTFCGKVEVPIASRLAWLATEALPGGSIEGLDRLFRVQGGTVVVSCGLGFGFVPIRFGAAPEVPVVTLRPPGGLAADSARAAPSVPDSLMRRYQAEPQDTI